MLDAAVVNVAWGDASLDDEAFAILGSFNENTNVVDVNGILSTTLSQGYSKYCSEAVASAVANWARVWSPLAGCLGGQTFYYSFSTVYSSSWFLEGNSYLSGYSTSGSYQGVSSAGYSPNLPCVEGTVYVESYAGVYSNAICSAVGSDVWYK